MKVSFEILESPNEEITQEASSNDKDEKNGIIIEDVYGEIDSEF